MCERQYDDVRAYDSGFDIQVEGLSPESVEQYAGFIRASKGFRFWKIGDDLQRTERVLMKGHHDASDLLTRQDCDDDE